jgi:hypothetical protein
VTDVLTFLEMLIESIFSKELGGPEKGRWVLIALRRAVWFLFTLIPGTGKTGIFPEWHG